MSTEIEFVPDPSATVNRPGLAWSHSTAIPVLCGDINFAGYSLSFPQFGVDNIAALRAVTPHLQDQIVTVLGLVVPTDGMGGGYRYETTSMAVDDGSTVVIPDNVDPSDPGRWLKYT